MRLKIIAVGTRMPDWVTAGWRDYAGRLPHECRLELHEIALARRRRGTSETQAKKEEGERMLAALRPDDVVVALELTGKVWTTEQLSGKLGQWMQDGHDTSLLIGGPDGLSSACLERAQLSWSLSRLTFPHAVVRILVAEQLYRAWTILQGHPYHRA